MSNFKKWINGEHDIFNQEVSPRNIENIERIDYEKLEKSVSGKEKRNIVQTNIKHFTSLYILLSILTVVAYIGVLLIMLVIITL